MEKVLPLSVSQASPPDIMSGAVALACDAVSQVTSPSFASDPALRDSAVVGPEDLSEENASENDLSGKDMPEGTRKCLASGVIASKGEMIRFVLDPEKRVVPDLAQKLPGRGLWVSAQREALELAVRKNLFARAAKTKAVVADDLTNLVEKLLAQRCRDLLGLARGSGLVVTGQPQVEEGAKKNAFAYILLASNAGADCRKKLSFAKLRPTGFTKTELAAALGREYVAAVGVKPHVLATKLRAELARWDGVRAPNQTCDSFSNNDDCEQT